jgi:hypothetical protein
MDERTRILIGIGLIGGAGLLAWYMIKQKKAPPPGQPTVGISNVDYTLV